MSEIGLYTARYGYVGPGRVDITRKGGSPFGPSVPLLSKLLAARKESPELAETLWPGYVDSYTAEMRSLWQTHRGLWVSLAERGRQDGCLVLCCFCANPARCHRGLLASMFVLAGPKLGVVLSRKTELMMKSSGLVCSRGSCKPFSTWEQPEK